MVSTLRIFILVFLAVLLVGSTAQASPQNMIHGEPAFDSGWRPTTGNFLRIPHGLSGPVEDFVWDVQLREPLGEASSGVTLNGIGGDRYDEGPTDSAGARVLKVDETDFWIVAGTSASTTQARVKIWKVPNPDYDSGWVSIDQGETIEFPHALGGNPDDYVVDLTMRVGSSIHQRYLGGDLYATSSGLVGKGANWADLDAAKVKVNRLPSDDDCEEVRVRIFVRPGPDYDSGWLSLSDGAGAELEHALGGPWNDLHVDLQLKSTLLGVHNRYCGGDRVGAGSPSWSGASWSGLTGNALQVWRYPGDVYVEQVRVRVWASRRPSYDSGWSAVQSSSMIELEHELGGDPDAYVVDLQLYDADQSIGAGINTYKYGGDWMYNTPAAAYDGRGAAWFGLDDSSVSVSRLANDLSAEQVRVRIWQASPPDWDSGWTSISQGETLQLDHGLGTSPAALAVDLQYRNTDGSGVNQLAFGGDQWYSNAQGAYVAHGALWRALTHNGIDVRRTEDDLYAEEVRVRIWKNTAFDAIHTDADADTGATVWNHGLGVNPEDLVVYQYAGGVSATYGSHQYQFGGDRIYLGGWVRGGAWWENLASSSMTLWRALDDIQSNDLFTRLWWTGRSEDIFSDGFESGDLSAWSNH